MMISGRYQDIINCFRNNWDQFLGTMFGRYTHRNVALGLCWTNIGTQNCTKRLFHL